LSKKKIFDMGKNSVGKLFIDGLEVGITTDVKIDLSLTDDFTTSMIRDMKERIIAKFRIPVHLMEGMPEDRVLLVSRDSSGEIVDFQPLSDADYRAMQRQRNRRPDSIPKNRFWGRSEPHTVIDPASQENQDAALALINRNKRMFQGQREKTKKRAVDKFPGRKIGIIE